ncbi:hypothetical protein LSTR_LSTR008314 [Laodelphax striatellus]|uniref:Uncharacterized protein n=1 Tax=Laodelphax striatellus TaxID=195883 RepID=A0A482XJU8_LAOST|nr:hypothetical protein LSTR_LSTR008314 [Laodelphax striatellus]
MEWQDASKLLLPMAIELGLGQGACLESAAAEEADVSDVEPEEARRGKKVTRKTRQTKRNQKTSRKKGRGGKQSRRKSAKVSAKRKRVYKDLLREILRKMKRNASSKRRAAERQEGGDTEPTPSKRDEGNSNGETNVPDSTGSDTHTDVSVNSTQSIQST